MLEHFDSTLIILICIVVIIVIILMISIKAARNKKSKIRKKETSFIKQPPFTFDISVEPEFPVYPNQDADIPAASYIYDQNQKIIGRSDGRPLNDADAAYLMREGYQHAKEYNNNHPNPKFHRTPDELEASYQFITKWGNVSSKKCDEFLNFAGKAYIENDTDRKIDFLQDAITAFNNAKEWHYAKSKGGKIYFQDTWEYMYNSQNPCFSWSDTIKQQIERITFERDILIPRIIDKSKEGFLQSEIYKDFPKQEQSYLRSLISSLASKGIILKEKKGNSYYIKINDK